MTQKKQEERVVHPLMEKEISFIGSWREWKELWGKTTQADILHSLLHFGFAVPVDGEEEWVDRILLYLNIADDHESYGFVKGPIQEDRIHQQILVGGEKIESFSQLRSVLSHKAFQMLCQNFLKDTKDGRYEDVPSWVATIADPGVLEKILWFFRLDHEGNFINLRLYRSEDHHSAIAKEFIRGLCKFAWTCENSGLWGREGIREETKEILRKNRPNMIMLLCGLGRLDLLLDIEKYELDKSCLQRLEELATSFDLYLPSNTSWMNERRIPRTIEEACLGDSQAAQVLLILRVKQAEKERFNKIRELNERRREAEEALKKL